MNLGRAAPHAHGVLPRIGTLSLIAGFLVVSAILRVVLGADAVMALSADNALSTEPTTAQTANISPSGDADDAATLLEALRAREARVAKREQALLLRKKALDIADAEIEKRLDALVAAEDRLRETLDLARGAAESDVAQLTEVYSRMKPKDAAILFEEMSPEFAAGFLARMKPDIAASVMAGLTPRRAYAISALLASRHADVPLGAADIPKD